jgi:hypothetical protein
MALALAAFPAAAGELASHRAVYSMRLVGAGARAGITGIRGAMVYEFKDVCDAWTVDARFFLLLRHGRGPEVESVRKLLTWESKKGDGFRFQVTESRDRRVTDQLKGVAVMGDGEKGGVVRYSRPRKTKVTLPVGTLFPTAHMRSLIHKSAAGGGILGKVLFDGATLDNPYEVNAVIGRYPKGEGRPRAVLKTDAEKRFFSARLAFFPDRSPVEVSDFEITVDFREDGVVERILQDFGDYSLEAMIDRMDLLPAPDC